MRYNPNIHHRKSIRLQEYDYSQEGLYFVTICAKNRTCLFGEIIDDKMCLSRIGIIADILWHEIKNHVTHVELHEFVVMPNHIHGIIEITQKMDVGNVGNNVGATHALPLQSPSPSQSKQSRFQNQGKNTLSSIVGSYKSAVTKHAHRLGFSEFAWQRNYWENIIRNNDDYARITQYIINNVINWKEDKFYIL
jgi:REP element-mobilizing transposase RayT